MRELAERHPNLTTWLVLAIGMQLVLAWSAREVVLSASQWFWLAVATTLLAGLCAWIISWEADEPDEVDDTAVISDPAQADTANAEAAQAAPAGSVETAETSAVEEHVAADEPSEVSGDIDGD